MRCLYYLVSILLIAALLLCCFFKSCQYGNKISGYPIGFSLQQQTDTYESIEGILWTSSQNTARLILVKGRGGWALNVPSYWLMFQLLDPTKGLLEYDVNQWVKSDSLLRLDQIKVRQEQLELIYDLEKLTAKLHESWLADDPITYYFPLVRMFTSCKFDSKETQFCCLLD